MVNKTNTISTALMSATEIQYAQDAGYLTGDQWMPTQEIYQPAPETYQYPAAKLATAIDEQVLHNVDNESQSWRRMELIQMLIPVAISAGATSVENIINTASKLEKYIITGVNPLEQPVIDHSSEDGPITSDTFEADLGEQFIVDEAGVLQTNPAYVPF